ncbi:uncharacterized protein EAF01_006035 [Botrytis porri]|uniref:uncharacterized protein n=1 Tax=Botrytis porri TaxID=87229 RepID=UPI001902763D|nr:uncharacterized protein EAF01_006035 [Botrytis porri]KAF7905514.1 hypothetical protein EAF01_006035 [Botrytis porri]
MSSAKAKERKNLEPMAQKTPVNRRRNSLPSREDSVDEDSFDESNYSENDDGGESISGSSSSSEVGSKSDLAATNTLKALLVSQRRYIPDFDSLPKTGVWISPAPSKHTEFKQVVVRTTKCDICNQKVEAQDKEEDGKVMQRCRCCNIQFCQDCVLRVSEDEIHYPVLAELEWEAKTKVNAITRGHNGFKDHMFHKPRSEPKPVRPMTASERLANSRAIASGKFSNMAVNTPTPSRPSRAKTTKAAAKKSKKRELPPGYASEEGDPHYDLDLDWIQSLPIEEQRKERKEAAQRKLLRKPILETMEYPGTDEAEIEPTPKTRTPLPNAPKRRKVATRTPATRRRNGKSTNTAAATSDVETPLTQPPRNTLDSLSQAHPVTGENLQEMTERSDENQRSMTPSHDDFDNEDCIRVEANDAEEDEYEPENN